jgi:hypothetical protein
LRHENDQQEQAPTGALYVSFIQSALDRHRFFMEIRNNLVSAFEDVT